MTRVSPLTHEGKAGLSNLVSPPTHKQPQPAGLPNPDLKRNVNPISVRYPSYNAIPVLNMDLYPSSLCVQVGLKIVDLALYFLQCSCYFCLTHFGSGLLSFTFCTPYKECFNLNNNCTAEMYSFCDHCKAGIAKQNNSVT